MPERPIGPLFDSGSDSLEARAVLDAARAIAIALVRDGVRYDAGLELAHREAIERWGRLIVHGERIVTGSDSTGVSRHA